MKILRCVNNGNFILILGILFSDRFFNLSLNWLLLKFILFLLVIKIMGKMLNLGIKFYYIKCLRY